MWRLYTYIYTDYVDALNEPVHRLCAGVYLYTDCVYVVYIYIMNS
jgi:hypothetical protein